MYLKNAVKYNFFLEKVLLVKLKLHCIIFLLSFFVSELIINFMFLKR